MIETAESIARAYAKKWLWRAVAPAAVPLFGGLTLLLIPLAVIAAPGNPDGRRVIGLLNRRDRCHRRRDRAGRRCRWAACTDHRQRRRGARTEPYAATRGAGHRIPGVPIRMLANDGSLELTAEQAAVTATSLEYAHDGFGSDHDSVNTFQQRWLAGWGTVAQLMDPVYAAAAFYDRLVEVSNWRTIPLTRAAQAVQVSAAGAAYTCWEPLARELTAMLWPTAQFLAANPRRRGVRRLPKPRCPPDPDQTHRWHGHLRLRASLGHPARRSDIAGPRDSLVYAAAAGTAAPRLHQRLLRPGRRPEPGRLRQPRRARPRRRGDHPQGAPRPTRSPRASRSAPERWSASRIHRYSTPASTCTSRSVRRRAGQPGALARSRRRPQRAESGLTARTLPTGGAMQFDVRTAAMTGVGASRRRPGELGGPAAASRPRLAGRRRAAAARRPRSGRGARRRRLVRPTDGAALTASIGGLLVGDPDTGLTRARRRCLGTPAVYAVIAVLLGLPRRQRRYGLGRPEAVARDAERNGRPQPSRAGAWPLPLRRAAAVVRPDLPTSAGRGGRSPESHAGLAAGRLRRPRRGRAVGALRPDHRRLRPAGFGQDPGPARAPALLDAPGAALVTLTKAEDLLLTLDARADGGRPVAVCDPFGSVPACRSWWDPGRLRRSDGRRAAGEGVHRRHRRWSGHRDFRRRGPLLCLRGGQGAGRPTSAPAR